MQNQTIRKTFTASAIISELQSSDIYLTVKARLLDLRANLNGVRVTSAFLDEIVDHKDKYVGIPLCADVRGLLANKTIGHMYDTRTGEFHSTFIGSFYDFEREDTEETSYLVGYARIMKRNQAVCRAISQLFADNALKFSFEISCGAYTEEDDGTFIIDADPKNFLEGAAVVTFPACEDAVAMQLVAECLNGGEQEMPNENVTAEQNVAQEENQENQQQIAETETAQVETADTVYVHEEHTQVDRQEAYNCDTGESVEVEQITRVHTTTPVQTAEDKPEDSDDDGKDEQENDEQNDAQDNEDDQDEKRKETAARHEDNDDDGAAEAGAAAEAEANADPDTEPGQVTGSDESKNEQPDIIAELYATVQRIGNEIAELRKMFEASEAETTSEQTEVVAETKEPKPEEQVAEQTNPFMAEIEPPVKYTLLEKAVRTERHYSLLDKA